MSADSEFNYKLNSSPTGTQIHVTGTINEQSDLKVPANPGPRIDINTQGVVRINSLGVGAWIRFMNALAQLRIPIHISPLSVALVSQTSMISNFLGSAQVDSFLAPYFCPNCDHGLEQQFAVNDQVPEELSCPKCASAMEFDDDIKIYLTFRS